MKKKVILKIAVIIIVVGLVGVLAVFLANRASQTSEEEEFIPSAGKIDVSSLKQAKIIIYLESRSNSVMPDVLAAVNEKLRAELKTELEFQMIWDTPDQFLSRVRKDTASGVQCDAFFYSSSYFPTSLRQLVKEGLAKDLTTDLTKYAPDYISQFSSDELKAISINGKLYAIPYRIPTATRKCVMVRDNLMAKYNIPEIKNYKDFEVYLDAVKKNESNIIPLDYWDTTIGLFSEVNGYAVLDYELGLVYKWNDPDMKLMAWEQTPEFADGIKKIKEWYEEGYLIKNYGVAEIDAGVISSGRWSSFIGNWGDEFWYNSVLAAHGIKDYRYVAYQLNDGISARNSPLESSLVVNEKSTQSDRVLMFINWLQSRQENYDLLMYGVKGKNYTDMGDYIVPAEVSSEEDSFLNWGWRGPFRNIMYERANFSGLKEDIARYDQVIEEKTRYSPAAGFVPDYSSLQDIVTLRRMGYNDMDQKVYTGTLEENDTEEFIKEQKDNGTQKLVDEAQKQLDNFRKGQ